MTEEYGIGDAPQNTVITIMTGHEKTGGVCGEHDHI